MSSRIANVRNESTEPLSTRPTRQATSMAWAVLAVCGLICLSPGTAHSNDVAPATSVDGFTLRDYVGKEWSLDEAEGKHVVVAFLGVECPLVQLYAKRLEAIQADFAGKDVVVVGINSNLQDSLAEIASFARRQGISFLLLKDPGNQVADQFGAQRTPEVFVLDPKRNVRYHGRIDDQYTYGIQRPKPTKHFLRDALDQLLSGKEVSTPETETVGCHIGRVLTPKRDSEVTYSNQIARIFQKRCVECHRSGEIGPFPLTTYEESVGWAEMIDEVTHERRMPPWHADPKHDSFVNDARLTDDELRLIRDWVDAGAPEGDPQQMPPARKFQQGWRIGKPDQVVWMSEKPFAVKARGEVRYQYFSVDPGFKEDRWVQAAECRPGNRAVVHHIIVGLKDGESRKSVHGRRSEWLAATAPGAQPMILPPGQAKLIPAGSKFIFQMHYTPNGTPQTDRSCIGLKFADPKTVQHRVATHQAASKFTIPPHAANHRVDAEYKFLEDGLLLSMFPHMHLRGKSFTYTAVYPDGRPDELLLNVPHYDFNWQNGYVFKTPKLMPKGAKIKCVAHFDNSEENLANPDPSQAVGWGDQTWDEMMIGYFDICDADGLARTKQFVARAAKVDRAMLRDKASGALGSETAFQKFGQSVRDAMPQLDRVDWIVIDEGKLQVKMISQDQAIRRQLGGPLEIEVEGMALAKVAAQSKPVAHPKLADAKGLDFIFMRRRGMNSSIHFPINRQGRPGVLSFWSAEENGFPAIAEELLADLIAELSEVK